MTLAELQAAFHALVTRAANVPPGLAEELLAGTPDLPAAERAGVYADMYLWRLTDALRDDYPKLAALLGDARFLALGEAYARAHPSDEPDLGRFGRNLPAFLRALPAPERADLADLAALEWARAEVFLEAPAATVGRAALAGLGAGEFLELGLEPVPALRLLRLAHDVLPAWRRLEAGEPASAPVPAPTAVVAWRSGFDVFHARVEPGEAAALEAAIAGAPLAEVCAAFERHEDPAAAAFAALSSWLDEGWLAALSPRAPSVPGVPAPGRTSRAPP